MSDIDLNKDDHDASANTHFDQDDTGFDNQSIDSGAEIDNHDNDGEDYEEVRVIYTTTDDERGARDLAGAQGVQSLMRENERLHDHIGFNKKQLKLSLLVNCALVLLTMLLFIAVLSFPKTKYIATKDNTAICEVYPRDNPNLTDGTIREFGKDAIINLYSFDYVNYADQINSVLDRNFTPVGRAATTKAMEEAGIFEYVKDNALTFKATAQNAVRIEQKGVNADGKDFWILRFPMVLDIYSGQSRPIDTQNHLVTVRVVADTASVTNPNGLGVSSVTLAPL